MKWHLHILVYFLAIVTVWAEPSSEVKAFEAATDAMSKEEVLQYMGRGPDQQISPHLWRYRGSWTNSETFEKFNTVDIAFGMLTDSHKYGVMRYTWDNTSDNTDGTP